MLKFVGVALCLTVYITDSESIIIDRITRVPKDPAQPNSCNIDEGRIVVPTGRYTQLPKFCGVVRCDAGETENLYQYRTCPSPRIGGRCTTTGGDKSLPFPQCCSKQVCESG